MVSRILFINAIDVENRIATASPPLGLGYPASALRKEIGEEKIMFRIVARNIAKAIEEFRPNMVGISAVSQNFNRAIEYAEIAKKYNLPVIVGGMHISALPTSLTADMDVGVVGEGEDTIVELFNLFIEKGCLDKEGLEKIRGIVFRANGKIAVTKKRDPIDPLDKIPMPARDLFEVGESTSIFTSRGCPYDCTFCASCRFWGKVRFFSPEYVVEEIKVLVNKYEVKKIAFLDDLFVASKSRVRKILGLLREDGMLDKVRFTCNARSNVVSDELVAMLKEMNVSTVGMGFESGSPKTLKYLKGGNVSVDTHRESLKIFRKHGIEPHVSFIIGSPEESRDDILETLSFIKDNAISKFDLYVLTPFPGTPIWEYAKSRELVSDAMDWDKLNVNFESNYREAIMLSEKLTRDEIYRLFQLFVRFKKSSRRKARLKKKVERLKSILAKCCGYGDRITMPRRV